MTQTEGDLRRELCEVVVWIPFLPTTSPQGFVTDGLQSISWIIDFEKDSNASLYISIAVELCEEDNPPD